MIVSLFCNDSKPLALSMAQGICTFLREKNVRVAMPDEQAPSCQAEPLSHIKPSEIGFRITLGGDGTILRIVHRFPEINAPLVGINLGGLGFLADVPVKDVYPRLQELIEGKYQTQNRLMLEGISPKGEYFYAVNDIVVHRASNPSLIELAIDVDQTHLNTFSADGLIIATPTGSTAYSLATGGPILTPDLKACVLTPISPHTISNRPIVFYPQDEIQVEYLSHLKPVEVTLDGISSFQVQTDEKFRIKVSKKQFCLVKFPHIDYFSTLRTKLGWSGKLK